MVVSTVRHEQGGPPGGQESILAELGSAEVRESLVERETVRGWRKQEGESLLVHEAGHGSLSNCCSPKTARSGSYQGSPGKPGNWI